MKLLDQIVEQSTSDDIRLTTILRKCLVLSAQIKNDKLRSWVEGELNGYSAVDLLPPYRRIGISAKGLFLGGFGAQINDQPLPSGILKEPHRHWATTGQLREPISSYEALLSKKHEGVVIINWPADMVVHYQAKFIKGYALNRAWQEIPIGAVVALVDTVRTRLLQFALELKSEIIENESINPQNALEKVDKAVQTIIYGGTNVIGSFQGDVQLIGQQVVFEGDFGALTKALTAAGVEHEKVNELKLAIEVDKKNGAEKGFGANVAGWLLKAGNYAGKQGVKAATGVAQKLVQDAIMHYFGIGS